MSYTINNTEDVYKYAQILYDYLIMHGSHELAEPLAEMADACFASSEQAIEAHKKAFLTIKEHNPGLSPEHRLALESSLELLSKV